MDLPYGKYQIHPSREAPEGAQKPHQSCPTQADKEKVPAQESKNWPSCSETLQETHSIANDL